MLHVPMLARMAVAGVGCGRPHGVSGGGEQQDCDGRTGECEQEAAA
jgi:hypothetical protein